MKKLSLVLALSSFGLGALCMVQWHRMAGQTAQLASVQTELETKAQQVETLAARQKRAERQRRDLAVQADEATAPPQDAKAPDDAPSASVSTAVEKAVSAQESEKPDPAQGGFGKMLAKMLQDPDTKKFIVDQQRVMMDQMYSPLIKKMGLTPEETEQFKQLLVDNAAKGAEKAGALFGGGPAAKHAELAQDLVADQKNFDNQVKDLLGEGRYAMYKDYQQTVGERVLLNQFKGQLAEGANPLTDQQTEQLLQVMKEEKQNVTATTSQTDQQQTAIQAMASPEAMEKLIQSQETVNQRVFQRANQVLASDQLEAFGKFQASQLSMLRMSMSMARKMFAPEKSDSPSAP